MEALKKSIDDIYVSNGYKNRSSYLNSLAVERGIDRNSVAMIADMLGETEDFDGLVTALDDFEDF